MKKPGETSSEYVHLDVCLPGKMTWFIVSLVNFVKFQFSNISLSKYDWGLYIILQKVNCLYFCSDQNIPEVVKKIRLQPLIIIRHQFEVTLV